MLDHRFIRQHMTEVVAALAKRGVTFPRAEFEALDKQRKSLSMATQELQNLRNTRSKAIGELKAKGEDIESVRQEVSKIGDDLNQVKQEYEAVEQQFTDLLAAIPNCPHEDVPTGKSEGDNILIRSWGEPTPVNFKAKDHEALGLANGGIDFAASTKLSGARFVVLRNQIARLQRALTQFMLDIHINEHGYQEHYVPYLVKSHCLFGTGQLPKFAEDQFGVAGESGLTLIPTAEVPLTNLVREEVLAAEQLPLKMVAHTPCFRSEAGSYGKDTHGMIRQHQFEKVELVQVVPPEESYQALEELTEHAEAILQLLQLPYRVMLLCGGDMGFSACKTYDIEVWLPGQDRYREISSCSLFGDFQARRMQARYRDPVTKKPVLVHTLNGSGLAVGRTLIAVMENYQDEQGRIQVPAVLQPYMNGLTIIE